MINIRKMKKTYALLLAFVLLLSSFGILSNGTSFKEYGVDISSHNGELDFNRIKAAGKSFVILRVGYSYYETGKKDDRFEEYYAAAKAAGLNVGAYIYSYAESVEDAKLDAKHVLSWIEGKKFEYPIFFDIEDEEYQGGLTTQTRTEMCLAFMLTMKDSGYLAGVYASQNWFNNYLDKNALSGYPLWLAKWTSDGTDSSGSSESYNLWQYTSSGKIDGMSCFFDFDVCYTDYPTYIKDKGLNGYTPTPKIPFTDVKETAWYYNSVKYCYEKGYLSGTGKTIFSPEMNMTRGMFVTVIGSIEKINASDYKTSPFLDVDMTEYYGPYVEWARQKSIVSGMGENKFEPDEAITREQMCRIICTYADAMDITFGNLKEAHFKDEDKISPWAYESVMRLANAGVVSGMGGDIFSPKSMTTRAQCAEIIKRIT